MIRLTITEKSERFDQIEGFCSILRTGDREGLDVVKETYPEIWSAFAFHLAEADVRCDEDDPEFRKALADLMCGFLSP